VGKTVLTSSRLVPKQTNRAAAEQRESGHSTAPDADKPLFAVVTHPHAQVLGLAILFCLGLFLSAKVFFRLPGSSDLLYGYGVAVTSVVTLQMFIAIKRYRDPALIAEPAGEESTTQEASTVLVSCLVAVHNEIDDVEACLRSMVGQTHPATEVIVVDDASTDGTGNHLEELATRLPIKLVRLETNVGKKAALAQAMLLANGEIIAFTDSDSIWAPTAIESCVRAFGADPDVGAISGHCRASNAEKNLLTRMQDSWYEGQFSIRKAFESHFRSVSCVSGPLAVFRREAIYNFIPAWEKDKFLGDYFRFATDRTLTGFVLMGPRQATRLRKLAADTPFASPAYEHRRWDVVYSKSARSLTSVPDNLRSFIKQQVRWKKSFLRNLFFTGAFYWQRPLVSAAAFYLHVAFVLAGPFVAFRHLVYLPLHGSAESMVLYLAGIIFVGSMFGLAYRREDPQNGQFWWYRLLMSLTSTLVLSWLIGYSLVTIKKMTWARG
jgi:cellulose synthase/poly-beta-1,6-N-acetylglucosamine synthase-like glycosyltransferase